MGIWYCSREDVKASLDMKETARNNAQIDRLIEAASRSIEGLTHRRFYPWSGTRYFDWPALGQRTGRAGRLWLDDSELISVSSLVSGGVTIPPSDYFLEANRTGPPYNRIDLNFGTKSAFNVNQTFQQSIAVTGVFGACNDSAPAGALAAAITSVGQTTVNVTDSSVIGVGQLIKIDNERMQVTGKVMLSTGQNWYNTITASNSDVTVTVTTGSAYAVDEVILLDSERMLIVDIAGNNLTVKRAWDGSVLASHTPGQPVYALRTLAVERGVQGTTAATHLNTAATTKHVVPGLVNQLAIAETMTALQQEGSAYGRVVGSGDAQREASGKGLADLRCQVYDRYGRKVRVRAV